MGTRKGASREKDSRRCRARFGVGDARPPGGGHGADRLTCLDLGRDDLVRSAASGQLQVAVVSVMSKADYTAFYTEQSTKTNPPSGTTPKAPLYGVNATHRVWVTLAPELQRWCRRYVRGLKRAGVKHPERRVRPRVTQRLGLDPERRYTRVVEMWVEPANVFRPCPDPDVVDRRCDLTLPSPTPQVNGIDDYAAFFSWLYYASYTTSGAPWTRLGYTYDWGGGSSNFGASEYILTASTPWEVRSAATLNDYCG